MKKYLWFLILLNLNFYGFSQTLTIKQTINYINNEIDSSQRIQFNQKKLEVSRDYNNSIYSVEYFDILDLNEDRITISDDIHSGSVIVKVPCLSLSCGYIEYTGSYSMLNGSSNELIIGVKTNRSADKIKNALKYLIEIIKDKYGNNDENNPFSSKVSNEYINFVFVCNGLYSKKYHFDINCPGLENCTTSIIKVSLAEAKKLGRTLCGYEKYN